MRKQVFTTDMEALRVEALSKLQGQQYQAAIADFNRLLQLDAQDFQSLYGRGLCCFQQRDFEGAIADMAETFWIYPTYALQQHPTSEMPWVLLTQAVISEAVYGCLYS